MLICFESDTVPVTEWGFSFFFRNSYTKIKVDSTQCPRANLNKMFLPGAKTTTA